MYTPNSCPKTWGAIVGSGNCLVVFHTPFFPFQPPFKLNKISLKFIFTPALTGGLALLVKHHIITHDNTKLFLFLILGLMKGQACGLNGESKVHILLCTFFESLVFD